MGRVQGFEVLRLEGLAIGIGFRGDAFWVLGGLRVMLASQSFDLSYPDGGKPCGGESRAWKSRSRAPPMPPRDYELHRLENR